MSRPATRLTKITSGIFLGGLILMIGALPLAFTHVSVNIIFLLVIVGFTLVATGMIAAMIQSAKSIHRVSVSHKTESILEILFELIYILH